MAIPEVAGCAAILVEPRDEAGLRAGIERAVLDPAEAGRLTAAGYRNLARFSWDRAARETLATWREAAAGSARRAT
jgi:glycosyltransferase involved in cell wall biosynthesis